MEAAATAIEALSRVEENKYAIARCGAMGALVAITRNGRPLAQELAANALATLTSSEAGWWERLNGAGEEGGCDQASERAREWRGGMEGAGGRGGWWVGEKEAREWKMRMLAQAHGVEELIRLAEEGNQAARAASLRALANVNVQPKDFEEILLLIQRAGPHPNVLQD
ncbi:MAG: hypothetical protein SGPRY_009626 [Prymnesium sp.]